MIIEREGNRIDVLEIKAGQTFSNDYLKSLKHFPGEYGGKKIRKSIVYRGAETTTIRNIDILSWDNFIHKWINDSGYPGYSGPFLKQ